MSFVKLDFAAALLAAAAATKTGEAVCDVSSCVVGDSGTYMYVSILLL